MDKAEQEREELIQHVNALNARGYKFGVGISAGILTMTYEEKDYHLVLRYHEETKGENIVYNISPLSLVSEHIQKPPEDDSCDFSVCIMN